VAAGNCTTNRVVFTEQQRADGMAIVDKLRALFASGTPVRRAAVPCSSLLEVLPPELLIAVIHWLDNRSLSSGLPPPAGSCIPTGHDR
jgi:hypothetical protein